MNRRFKSELEKIPTWSELYHQLKLRLGVVKPEYKLIEVKQSDWDYANYEETIITGIDPFDVIPPRLSKRQS